VNGKTGSNLQKVAAGAYTNLNTLIYSGKGGGELQHEVALTTTSDPAFDFTAPATLGTYTIYGCLNQVDNDGSGFDADDGPAVCASTTFTVSNSNPDAVDDNPAITVGEDDGLSSVFNVLSNDTQTESDSFSWDSTNTTGLSGSLTDNSDGTYRYDPNGQFESLADGETGSDTFTYTIEEDSYAGYTDTATVTISITGANDRPVAVDDGSGVSAFVTVDEGAAVDNGTDADGGNNDLASNDTDVDATDNLDATRTSCPAGVSGPSNGTITNFDADGTFTYTHDGSETTSDSFTYCSLDDSGTGTSRSSNSATVYIEITPVNDAPTVSGWDGTPAFTEDVSGAVTLDSTVTISDAETSDQITQATIEITNDQTGDTLACTAGFPGGGSCSYSSGVLTISGSDSRANYETYIEGVQFDNTSDTPNTTNRTLRLIVQDDGTPNESSSAADITLTVADTNDDPTASDDGAAGGSPNGFVSVQEGNTIDNGTDADGTNDDLRDNDNDPDGDALTTTQSASCVGGAGAAPSNASSFTLDTDGTFSYTHDGTNTTTDSFSYCVFDGTAYSSLATVYIDITPVNDAPTINDFSGTTGTYTEQTPLTMILSR